MNVLQIAYLTREVDRWLVDFPKSDMIAPTRAVEAILSPAASICEIVAARHLVRSGGHDAPGVARDTRLRGHRRMLRCAFVRPPPTTSADARSTELVRIPRGAFTMGSDSELVSPDAGMTTDELDAAFQKWMKTVNQPWL